MAEIFEGGGSELDRVLRQTFPKIKSKLPSKPSPQPKFEIGDFDSAVNLQNQVLPTPGLTYQGGPQSAGGGSPVQRRIQRKLDHLFAGIDPKQIPEWMNDAGLEVLSRMLETTFRNFQQTSRRPSHMDPPFQAQPIDVYASGVTLVGGSPDFTPIVTFKVPSTQFRAEIQSLGQAAETDAAFNDIEWQVVVDGTPYHPWEAVDMQLWQIVPPTPLSSPIHLISNRTITLQAVSLSARTHIVSGRIGGWFYPVRSETGPEIRSTIVD